MPAFCPVVEASRKMGSPEKRVGTEQMNNIQKTDNRVELGK